MAESDDRAATAPVLCLTKLSPYLWLIALPSPFAMRCNHRT